MRLPTLLLTAMLPTLSGCIVVLDFDDDSAGDDDSAACSPTLSEADAALTPRADRSLEQLAVLFDGTISASQSTYDRVVVDVAAIHAAEPSLAGITHQGWTDGRTLNLGLDASALAAVAAGTWTVWDCLNDRYGFVSANVSSFSVLLELEGTYDLLAVGADYASLPGVIYAEPNGLIGDGPTICGGIDGEEFHYIVDVASGDCPAGCIQHVFHHFVTAPDGTVTPDGMWDNQSGTPSPTWLATWGAGC